MAQYSYTTYSADALIYDPGSNSWALRPDFDSKLHLINLTINDDDNIFDGDAGADEVGADANQTGFVTDQNGNTIASGQVYDEEFYSVYGGANNQTIWIEKVEIGGVHVGYLVSAPFEPGGSYRQTDIPNNDVSANNAPSYSGFSEVPHTVDGTATAELIDGGYVDIEGDQVDGTDGADDVIMGYDGADTINGGAGNDYIDGGADADTFFLTDNFGLDTLVGGEGGVDDDLVDFSNLSQGVQLVLSSTEAGRANSGTDSAVFSEIERFRLSSQDDSFDGSAAISALDVEGGGGNDSIVGGAGADAISGGAGNDTLDGSAGHDRMGGDAGDDSILGGAGNDTLSGGDGADVVRGGNDSDVIEGDAGNDHLYGDAGNDSVLGGAGDDTLYMGSGDDTLHGGVGSDYFIANDGFGRDTVTGGEDVGDAEYDVLDFRGHTQAVTINFTGSESGTAAAGTDTVTFSEIEGFWLSNQADSVDGSASTSAMAIGAGAGDDTIIGGSGADAIAGQDGNDLIESGAGNDSIDAGIGNDTVLGGAGDDLIYGQAGADSLSGGDGSDVVYGGTETDTIHGGAGDDILFGEAGDDHVGGGVGNDGIAGGAGNDRLHGEAGNDTISGGIGNDAIFGGAGDDSVVGDAGDDHIIGGDGADSLAGGDGNDYIHGDDSSRHDGSMSERTASSNEPAQASATDGSPSGSPPPSSKDTLSGGAGNDTLDGGEGDDLLTGGGGDDLFLVSEGNDTVTDFNFGNTGAIGDGNSSNNDVLNVGAYYDSLDELRADQADDGKLNQSNSLDDEGKAVDYSDNARYASNSSMTVQGASADSYTYDNTGIVCFAAGTNILTPEGEVAIETLKPGDLVETLDHGAQPLLWIGQRHVGDAELNANPELRPVRIAKGVLGNQRTLLVSRQHGMMIGNSHLARAIHLVPEFAGVRVAHGKREITYVHLFFARHEIVFAEGIPSESFYPGPTALRMLSPAARLDLLKRAPMLNLDGVAGDMEHAQTIYGKTVRPFAKPKDIRAIGKIATCAV